MNKKPCTVSYDINEKFRMPYSLDGLVGILALPSVKYQRCLLIAPASWNSWQLRMTWVQTDCGGLDLTCKLSLLQFNWEKEFKITCRQGISVDDFWITYSWKICLLMFLTDITFWRYSTTFRIVFNKMSKISTLLFYKNAVMSKEWIYCISLFLYCVFSLMSYVEYCIF